MEHFPVPDLKGKPDMQRLIREYGDSILRMCVLYLHDIHLAEDAVQETYIRVYEKWGQFKGNCSEKTWITSIAINVCKSQLRSAWFRNRLCKEEAQKEPFQEDPPLWDDTVLQEISSLKPRYKEVILLFYYQEMKTKEIAVALGVTESAVSVRLNRARKQLKKSLKGWYYDE
ncbi:RNA polymerase sigma factor [Clostridium aminobutyricum]|uniref:Sigma-70 family RNA polymerase sigma factor n=1 Tax=Clostridium aminobutyricum TaxID=33953 RepID=A0A939D7V0_CLOAM|nr:sigma-70 family RNA polymerase sigma factor [Clostridium aminobutyricum]MBN7773109.1 sigma-70 family RNA polymerase sigma factor [Clostridium aminobutyricum]